MKHLMLLLLMMVTGIVCTRDPVVRRSGRNPFAASKEVIAEKNAFLREKQRKSNARALKKYAKYCGLGETEDAILVFIEWRGDLCDLYLGDVFGKIWTIISIDDDFVNVESIIDGDRQTLRRID